MKFSLAILGFSMLVLSTSAFADINTVCNGGTLTGREYSVSLQHITLDQKPIVTINGQKVEANYIGMWDNGETLRYSIAAFGKEFSLSYRQLDAVGALEVDGQEIELFCSRGL